MLISEDFYAEKRFKMEILDQEDHTVVKYNSKYNFVATVLELSQEHQYQDVTILCDGGKCQTNSFLLASLFPIVKNIVEPSHEEKFISFPDIDHQELSDFISSILRKVFIKNVFNTYIHAWGWGLSAMQFFCHLVGKRTLSIALGWLYF